MIEKPGSIRGHCERKRLSGAVAGWGAIKLGGIGIFE
jgi:hypothetical protein